MSCKRRWLDCSWSAYAAGWRPCMAAIGWGSAIPCSVKASAYFGLIARLRRGASPCGQARVRLTLWPTSKLGAPMERVTSNPRSTCLASSCSVKLSTRVRQALSDAAAISALRRAAVINTDGL